MLQLHELECRVGVVQRGGQELGMFGGRLLQSGEAPVELVRLIRPAATVGDGDVLGELAGSAPRGLFSSLV
ncbi:hypothetical protein ACGFX4_20105 [Kitasatospora sp. NPDC048365]|uniref:hypothetical protein n=1 Tax=Kitasatospora sp. NPDC048365 TaxID=3364050 RepID=UPI00371CE5C6